MHGGLEVAAARQLSCVVLVYFACVAGWLQGPLVGCMDGLVHTYVCSALLQWDWQPAGSEQQQHFVDLSSCAGSSKLV